jgi:uncharacterized protein (DUF2267 family)
MGTLEYGQLLQGVEMAAGLNRAAAERIVRATLATLAERLGREDFIPLAARLPDELRQPPGEAAAEPAPFPPEEFVRRAARRAGIDQDSAWVQSRRCWPPCGKAWPRWSRSARDYRTTTA